MVNQVPATIIERINRDLVTILRALGETDIQSTLNEMMGPGKPPRIVELRGACSYYLHEIGEYSYPTISSALGRRCHSTYHTASQRYKAKLESGEVQEISLILGNGMENGINRTLEDNIDSACLRTLRMMGRLYPEQELNELRKRSDKGKYTRGSSLPQIRRRLAFWLTDYNPPGGTKLSIPQITKAVGYVTEEETRKAIEQEASHADKVMREDKQTLKLAERDADPAQTETQRRRVKNLKRKLKVEFPEEIL